MSKWNFFEKNPKVLALLATCVVVSCVFVLLESKTSKQTLKETVHEEVQELERQIGAWQKRTKQLEKELNASKLALWQIPAAQFLQRDQNSKRKLANLHRAFVQKERECQILATELSGLTAKSQTHIAKIQRLEGTVEALCELTHTQKGAIKGMEKEHIAAVNDYKDAINKLYATKKELKENLEIATSSEEKLRQEVANLHLALDIERSERSGREKSVADLLATVEMNQKEIDQLRNRLSSAETDVIAQMEFTHNIASELKKTGSENQELCQNCATLSDMLSFFSLKEEEAQDELVN